MANLSDAFGTITITAPNPTLLAQFLYLQNLTNEDAHYYTYFYNMHSTVLEEVQEYVDKHVEHSNDQAILSLRFTALGRWAYIHNIKWFFAVLNEDYWTDEEPRTLARTLREHPFKADFDVTDSEEGFGFIAKFTQETKWNPETKQVVFEPAVHTVNEAYTATNLIQHELYDKGEVWDMGYIRNNFDYFVEEVKDCDSSDQNFPVVRQNILNNPDGFKKFINDTEFDDFGVCYELDDILFGTMKLTPETKF